MRISKFNFARSVRQISSIALPECDNFTNSDFFFKGGLRLRDIDVYARADTNPELRRKLNEFLIERDVVSSSSSDLTEEQIMSNLETKYSINAALNAVRDRLSDILSKEKQEALKKNEN